MIGLFGRNPHRSSSPLRGQVSLQLESLDRRDLLAGIYPSMALLTVVPLQITAGESVAVRVTVESAPPLTPVANPSGNVEIFANTLLIGQLPLFPTTEFGTSTATGAFTVTTVGNVVLTAVYDGDDQFTESRSNSVPLSVTAPPPPGPPPPAPLPPPLPLPPPPPPAGFPTPARYAPPANLSADTIPLPPAINPESGLTGIGRVAVVGAAAGGGPVVRVLDPITGEERGSFFAYEPEFLGGVRVSMGDVNGDFVPDIVTVPGPGGGPNVKVFDGQTGVMILSFFAYDSSFTGGVFVALGDISGDGANDIITGTDIGGGPNVKVFDGPTGTQIFSFFAFDPTFPGGVRVAAGDFNGDGSVDVITAAGPGGGPRVQVFSGPGLGPVTSFFAFEESFTGGVYVASGDVTGNGRNAIITGTGIGASPRVRVYSSRTASLIVDFNVFSTASATGVPVGVADWDGDGRDDVLTGVGSGNAPTMRVFNGQTGALIAAEEVFSSEFLGGIFVNTSDATSGLNATWRAARQRWLLTDVVI